MQFEVMADSVEVRMSVTSIKRVDPYVKDILATSTHVALYKFNSVTNEWEKTETEGALFLYSRNGEPYHSIMIMNRLNTNNLIEPIVKEFEYQMQIPFLLYRNPKNKIFGIWFYDREECVNITYLLESLMEAVREKEKTTKPESGVDIFSMLSKAQEDFNKTPNKKSSQPQFQSTPRAPDLTSQSVMDFFAKAGTKTTQKPVPKPGDGENLLHRLMSNPAHSVEHIEKQQRSTTPQEQVVVRQKPSLPIGLPDHHSAPVSLPSATSERKPENGFNFTHIGSPPNKPVNTSPLTNFMIQKQSQYAPAADDSDALATSPLAAPVADTPQKLSLMPPILFTTSTNRDKRDPVPPQTFDNNAKSIEPLTKKQMLQALNYLIKNDTDFVNKLHEAYVKSIKELVSNSCGTGGTI